MNTVRNMILVYGAVLVILMATKLMLGIELNPVMLLVSPAVVASMFLVRATSLFDPEG